MKGYVFSFLLVTLTLSCKAQTPVLSINDANYGNIENAYFKDLDGFLDPFEGTWLYTNGSTSLKLVLQKKEMFYEKYDTKKYYVDYLVGEYQYIENGIEKVNTLSNLLLNHDSILDYNIRGFIQERNSVYPVCDECTTEFERLLVRFNEPSRRNVRGLASNMVFRRFEENVNPPPESIQGVLF